MTKHNMKISTRTEMETMLVTLGDIIQWRIPDFQRPLRVNEKVRALAEQLKSEGGILPGVITLGVLDSDIKTRYVVDGQHRLEACRLTELNEFIMDVRIVKFATMAEMAEEFVGLNQALVKMSPDDVLRGMEGSIHALRVIHEQCPFVTYGKVKRGTTSLLGMSVVIRCWSSARNATPAPSGGGASAMAQAMDERSAQELVNFLKIAHVAWGKEAENTRLWGTLNLTLCMWLYRNLVLTAGTGLTRHAILTPDNFKSCLLSLSADHAYCDWLVGRQMGERDRGPCYGRITTIFRTRMQSQYGDKKSKMPRPEWARNV